MENTSKYSGHQKVATHRPEKRPVTERHYRIMFLVVALWNVLGGIAIIALTRWIFTTSALAVPHPPVYYQSWIALFMTFGIGYYMVSRDPLGNRNIVILGIVGKLAFSAIYIANRLAYGQLVPLLFGIPMVGDLIFVVLFGMYLNFARKRQR